MGESQLSFYATATSPIFSCPTDPICGLLTALALLRRAKSVKKKATEYGLYRYLEKKNGHSKLDNLFYSGLSTQEYLTNSDLTAKQAQLIFKYRVRMASYSEDFRGYSGHTPCPLCLAHLDSQAMCMTCPVIRENVTIEGTYSQIFTNKITKELVKTVEAVDRYREDFLQSRYLDNGQ